MPWAQHSLSLSHKHAKNLKTPLQLNTQLKIFVLGESFLRKNIVLHNNGNVIIHIIVVISFLLC